MDRSSRQKINSEIMALCVTLGKIDLLDIYRSFYPHTAECPIFLKAHETFSRTNHILGHKRMLKNSEKVKLYQAYFLNIMA